MARARSIVIIGGGVIGSAVASFLGERGAGERVVVIERDPGYRRASSALSASSIRQQFSTPINNRDLAIRKRVSARGGG